MHSIGVSVYTAGRMHRISLCMHTAGRMHSIGHIYIILLGYRFNGQFRFSENLMCEKNVRKLLPPRVYNGLCATVFCVTKTVASGN